MSVQVRDKLAKVTTHRDDIDAEIKALKKVLEELMNEKQVCATEMAGVC